MHCGIWVVSSQLYEYTGITFKRDQKMISISAL